LVFLPGDPDTPTALTTSWPTFNWQTAREREHACR
jgi:hypothetical protein